MPLTKEQLDHAIKKQREERSLYRKRIRYFRKTRLVELMGGKCEICEYSNCLFVLVFHHIFPDKKEFPLTSTNLDKKSSEILNEILKTMLLCANCHRELHAGLHTNYEELCRRDIEIRVENIRSIIRKENAKNKCGYLSIKIMEKYND